MKKLLNILFLIPFIALSQNLPPVISGITSYTTSNGSVTLNFSATDDGSIGAWKVSLLKSPTTVKANKIAAIGSSTGSGVGSTGYSSIKTSDSSLLGRLKNFYKSYGLIDTIFNRCVASTYIYQGMPTGYVPPVNDANHTIDTTRNLTAAMNRVGTGGLVYVLYPTNGFDNYTVAEVMNCMRIMRDTANARGINIVFGTTQPREGLDSATKVRLRQAYDSIMVQFPNNHVDQYWGFIDEPRGINGNNGTFYNRRRSDWKVTTDSIHFNDAGHAQFAKQHIAFNGEALMQSGVTIIAPNSPTPTITGLSTGTYYFVAAAQDNDRLWSYNVITVNATASTTYYTKAVGELTNPTTFGTNTDGSGTTPINFTSDNQIFEIRNRTSTTISADWTVSGTSSKITVGTGVDFTIPSTNKVTATIDVSNGGELTILNTTFPTFGILATGSTVEYAQSSTVSILNFTANAVTYSNLKLTGSGTKTFKNSTTTVTGDLTFDGSTNGTLTLDAASAAVFTTVTLGGNLTYLGTVNNPVDANSYTLQTTGSGTQTITAAGNTARFFSIITGSSGNNVVLSTAGGSTNTLLGNAVGGGLTLSAGTTLTLGGNTVTFFNGGSSVLGSGTITGSSTSSIIINRSAANTFGTLNFTSGSRSLNNLTVNHTGTTPTVTLGTALDIYNTLTVSSGTLATGGTLTLKSDANGTARLAESPGTISGNVTVERFIPVNTDNGRSGKSWRLLTSPVTGTTINAAWQGGTTWDSASGNLASTGQYTLIPGQQQANATTANNNGFDFWSYVANSAASVRKYVGTTTSGSYTPLVNTTSPITDEPAYMLFLRGDRSVTSGTAVPTVLRPTGTLRTGTQSLTVKGTNTQKFTLLGNPYASPIDFEQVILNADNNTKIYERFWIWAADQGSFGAYRLVNRTGTNTYEVIPSPYNIAGTTGTTAQHIQSSQGFFVESQLTADATITVEENDKSNPSSVYSVFRTGNTNEKLNINLNHLNADNTTTLADGVQAKYDSDFSASIADEDIQKPNNFNENLAIQRSGSYLIVEGRPLVNSTDTTYLNLWNTTQRSYQFQLKAENFNSSSLSAFLVDKYLSTSKDINLHGDVTSINFAVNGDAASRALDRFMIVYRTNTTHPVNFTNIKAAQKQTAIQVDWNVATETNTRSYEVEKSTNGQQFVKAVSVAATGNIAYNWLDVMPANGMNYYRVKGISGNGEVKYSGVARVNMNSVKTGVTVYPNPLTDKSFNLQLNNKEKGTYTLRLINSAGQLVFSSVVSHSGGSSSQTVQLNKELPKGIYQLEITREDRAKETITIISNKD
ncbi:MAG TPA: T9SS type A sorting domain-containing protein [Segetibacter sp.]